MDYGNQEKGVKIDRYQISADELNHRMEGYQKTKIDPGQKAAAILEVAIDTVLTKLGVNVENADTVAAQMDAMGIVMTENTDERTPQLNGFFIFVTSKRFEMVPYAWVGSARLNSDGQCFCDIHWFLDERLSEIGGEKLVR